MGVERCSPRQFVVDFRASLNRGKAKNGAIELETAPKHREPYGRERFGREGRCWGANPSQVELASECCQIAHEFAARLLSR